MKYTLEFGPVLQNINLILQGIVYTATVSAAAIVIGLLLGTLAASLMTSQVKALSVLAAVYVEIIRNTPLLIQVWLFYFGLVQIGIDLSALASGILALGINTGAYAGDVIRAGFESIDRSILDASASLGFPPFKAFLKIRLPLAIRAVLPSLGNTIIQCLLASALLSVLGINELTNQTLRISNKTFRSFESFIIAGALYIILNLLLTGGIELFKKRVFKGSLR